MRLLCGLRQIDVAFSTGVSVSSLAAAEHGRRPLNYTEHALVLSFLNERWTLLEEEEEAILAATARAGIRLTHDSEEHKAKPQERLRLPSQIRLVWT